MKSKIHVKMLSNGLPKKVQFVKNQWEVLKSVCVM